MPSRVVRVATHSSAPRQGAPYGRPHRRIGRALPRWVLLTGFARRCWLSCKLDGQHDTTRRGSRCQISTSLCPTIPSLFPAQRKRSGIFARSMRKFISHKASGFCPGFPLFAPGMQLHWTPMTGGLDPRSSSAMLMGDRPLGGERVEQDSDRRSVRPAIIIV